MISIPAGRLQNLGPFIPHYCDDKGCTGVSVKFSQSIDDYNDILQFEYTHTPSSSIGFANRLSYDFSSIDGDGGLIGVNRTVSSSGWECPRINCHPGQRQCGYMFPRDDKNTHVCGAERDVTVEFCGVDAGANGSGEVAVQDQTQSLGSQTFDAVEGQDDEQDGGEEEDGICYCPCRKSKKVKAPKLRLFNGYDLPPY